MFTKLLMISAVMLTAGMLACGSVVVGTTAVVYQSGSAAIQVVDGEDDFDLKIPTVALNLAARYAPEFLPREAVEAMQPAAELFQVLPDKLAELPDGVYIEVQNEYESVLIAKAGGYMHLQVEDRRAGDSVNLRLPVSTMIAFTRGLQRAIDRG